MSCSFSSASRRSGYLAAVLGVDAAVDHGLGGAVARQGLGGGVVRAGDGVAHLGVLDVFDAGGEVAHLTGLQRVGRLHRPGAAGSRTPAHGILGAGGHHADGLPVRMVPCFDPEVDDDAHDRGRTGCRRSAPAAGAFGSPLGAGTFCTMSSSTASMLMPMLGGDLRARPWRAGR